MRSVRVTTRETGTVRETARRPHFSLAIISVTVQLRIQVFWVTSVYFNVRNIPPPRDTVYSGTTYFELIARRYCCACVSFLSILYEDGRMKGRNMVKRKLSVVDFTDYMTLLATVIYSYTTSLQGIRHVLFVSLLHTAVILQYDCIDVRNGVA